jgi:hypothetical protein
MNEFVLIGEETLSNEFNALAEYYSDFYKEVHGMRPRGMALIASAYPDRDALLEAKSHVQRGIDGLEHYLEAMSATPEGRAQLRDEGWAIDEPANDSLSD